MNRIDANLLCPACHDALTPHVLACEHCGIRVEGPFQFNEFATLDGDDLHLLRIFVLSEGRVRDMEAALGLSYPTIRNRLKDLRNKLAARQAVSLPERGTVPPASARHDDARVAGVLQRLQNGELSFAEAMRQIRTLQGAEAE
ncbi:MAG: DUF2089 domain-containing protein [Deltaproteobacteria bacterium]|nr:DUF2089 domain-containing protein [Deltaproteobacteria bacterium]